MSNKKFDRGVRIIHDSKWRTQKVRRNALL